MSAVYEEAKRLLAAGLCVLPIRTDGTKSPTISWKAYQDRLPTPDELRQWFAGRNVGIAIMGGRVSGNLAQLDFDDADTLVQYEQLVDDLGHGEKFRRLPKTRTPKGGAHIRAHVEGAEIPTIELACRYPDPKTTQVLIETRSEGAIALCPPSPASCHPKNLPYMQERGDLATIPTILAEEWNIYCAIATTFGDPKPQKEHRPFVPRDKVEGTGERPGEAWARQTSWAEILGPAGAKHVRQTGNGDQWRRPDKDGKGISALTGGDHDLLWVFSSNWHNLDQKVSYTKFGAFAALYHNGDYSAAAKALYDKGFGDRTETVDCSDCLSNDTSDDCEIPAAPEISADAQETPENDVTGIMRFVAKKLSGLPVEVRNMGLVIDMNASDKQFRQIFGRVLKIRNDIECPIQFALGDIYNALPRKYGERGAWVSANFGPGYSFQFRKWGHIAGRWPLELRRTGVPWTVYAEGAALSQDKKLEIVAKHDQGERTTAAEVRQETSGTAKSSTIPKDLKSALTTLIESRGEGFVNSLLQLANTGALDAIVSADSVAAPQGENPQKKAISHLNNVPLNGTLFDAESGHEAPSDAASGHSEESSKSEGATPPRSGPGRGEQLGPFLRPVRRVFDTPSRAARDGLADVNRSLTIVHAKIQNNSDQGDETGLGETQARHELTTNEHGQEVFRC